MPLQNELWNQIFMRWREGRSDNLTDLGACDGAFVPPPPTHGRLIIFLGALAAPKLLQRCRHNTGAVVAR